ncbi:hypothetical protein [Acetonema longum]|uniref:Uncharacterized protein n=1 Tax=Acetonema longum DSM 6540 TaxID=1009370 RepID=F7NNE8_9FIRM|nr:hypothetical protein [Acetonema longum]EGO62389.1 hypothetical protein ALO_18195 [Acetonema longum DSM 6540]
MTNDISDRSLWSSINRLIEKTIAEGTGYDVLINVLALFCLLSILQRNTGAQATAPVQQAVGGGLQKLIGELTKGEGGGPSPDALMSLLPLLNSPQVKSKLNPATLAAVFSLLNTAGASGEKQETVKHEPTKQDPPLAATESDLEQAVPVDSEKRGGGRYLNWKSSF